jgi:hypothetical protein
MERDEVTEEPALCRSKMQVFLEKLVRFLGSTEAKFSLVVFRKTVDETSRFYSEFGVHLKNPHWVP